MARTFPHIRAVLVVAPQSSSVTALVNIMHGHLRLNRKAGSSIDIGHLLKECALENLRFRQAYLDTMERGHNIPDAAVLKTIGDWISREAERNSDLQRLLIIGAPLTMGQFEKLSEMFGSVSMIDLRPSDKTIDRHVTRCESRWQSYKSQTLPFLNQIPSMPGVRETVLSLNGEAPTWNHVPAVLRHLSQQAIPPIGRRLLTRKLSFMGEPAKALVTV